MSDDDRPDELPDDYPDCTCNKRRVALYRLGYFCENCTGWIGA